MKSEIAAYITIITAIVAAFFTYRNQLRLKAFELFIAKRDSVLRDIEYYIKKLYLIQHELDSNVETVTFNECKKEVCYEGLILYYKILGARFGCVSSVFLESFYSLTQEQITNYSKLESKDWVFRTLNIITTLYGLAHSQVSIEIESMTFSFLGRFVKKYSSKMKGVKSALDSFLK
jgi:hypothetical protein